MSFVDDYVDKRSKRDPKFAEAWKESESEYEIVRALIRLRKESGLTQEQLAKLADMKQSAIARIETGDRNIRLDTLMKVAASLGARVEIIPNKRRDHEVVKE